ncbi:MAG: hypothetical protein K2M22_02685 [Lachnospiraceae bacterium]|nr:hypothetical protein [Lachnospiraceae bacterium]
MYALWKAFGNDIASFPSKESLYSKNCLLRYQRDTGELEYIIGTYTIENLTDGFPITSDNPRTYYRGLYAEEIYYDDNYDSTAAEFFNRRNVSVCMYSDGMSYYGENQAATIGIPRMVSNTWGPVCVVVALPNQTTPKQPHGYDYSGIHVGFCYNNYGSHDDSIYAPFMLKYYTKEVE